MLIGLVVGYKTSDQGAVLPTMSAYGSAALVLGVVLAIWLLCLGFVFADARRRDMRSVLWVLVAALFPHLLGFLLYFVMRHPIAATCTRISVPISIETGSTFLRCSTWAAPITGETTLPSCCSDWPRPTRKSEPGMARVIRCR